MQTGENLMIYKATEATLLSEKAVAHESPVISGLRIILNRNCNIIALFTCPNIRLITTTHYYQRAMRKRNRTFLYQIQNRLYILLNNNKLGIFCSEAALRKHHANT